MFNKRLCKYVLVFFDDILIHIRFVKGYSQLATPLTDLTRKGAFSWTNEAQSVFDRLKQVMSTCLVLALPGFS